MNLRTKFAGKRVLLIEGMVAEGEAAKGMARILKAWGATEVHLLSMMSKGLIQGGTEALIRSPFVDSVAEIIRVKSVDPETGKIILAAGWERRLLITNDKK